MGCGTWLLPRPVSERVEGLAAEVLHAPHRAREALDLVLAAVLEKLRHAVVPVHALAVVGDGVADRGALDPHAVLVLLPDAVDGVDADGHYSTSLVLPMATTIVRSRNTGNSSSFTTRFA